MQKPDSVLEMIKSELHVIFLQGKHNCGKTTTFNKLYKKWVEDDKIAIVEQPKTRLPSKNDFECILNYKGKRVALFSLGDFGFAPASAVGYYAKAECDILIVAYSLRNYIHQNSLFENRYPDVVVVAKEDCSDDEAVAKLTAEVEKIIAM